MLSTLSKSPCRGVTVTQGRGFDWAVLCEASCCHGGWPGMGFPIRDDAMPVGARLPLALPLLLAGLALSGCLSSGDANEAPRGSGGPGGADDAAPLMATDCRITLHVWLLPLDEMAGQTPPEFPPTAYRGEAPADTPLGRLVFYLYDCADPASAAGRSTLGLLAARVDAPPEVAPPSNGTWATMYVLHAWAGGAPTEVLDAAGIAATPAVASVDLRFAAPDVLSATMVLDVEGAEAFRAEMAGLPGQVEAFARPERYYVLGEGGNGDVRWVDVDFDTTLYESEGRVEYAGGTPWAEAVGLRAFDAAIDHHAMTGGYRLTGGNGTLA